MSGALLIVRDELGGLPLCFTRGATLRERNVSTVASVLVDLLAIPDCGICIPRLFGPLFRSVMTE